MERVDSEKEPVYNIERLKPKTQSDATTLKTSQYANKTGEKILYALNAQKKMPQSEIIFSATTTPQQPKESYKAVSTFTQMIPIKAMKAEVSQIQWDNKEHTTQAIEALLATYCKAELETFENQLSQSVDKITIEKVKSDFPLKLPQTLRFGSKALKESFYFPFLARIIHGHLMEKYHTPEEKRTTLISLLQKVASGKVTGDFRNPLTASLVESYATYRQKLFFKMFEKINDTDLSDLTYFEDQEIKKALLSVSKEVNKSGSELIEYLKSEYEANRSNTVNKRVQYLVLMTQLDIEVAQKEIEKEKQIIEHSDRILSSREDKKTAKNDQEEYRRANLMLYYYTGKLENYKLMLQNPHTLCVLRDLDCFTPDDILNHFKFTPPKSEGFFKKSLK